MRSIELATPSEIIEQIVNKVQEKQKLLDKSVEDVAKEAGMGKRTYENFLYSHNITLEKLLSILSVLDLMEEIKTLAKPLVAKDEDEHKKLSVIRENIQKKKDKKRKNLKTNKLSDSKQRVMDNIKDLINK